jgi:hypothetical protein
MQDNDFVSLVVGIPVSSDFDVYQIDTVSYASPQVA